MAWYDYYSKWDKNGYRTNKFDISIKDLKKWASIYGNVNERKQAQSWGETDSDARKAWGDKNSGIHSIFRNFTNWVKNNGGLQNRKIEQTFGSPENSGEAGFNNKAEILNSKLTTQVHGPYTERTWTFNPFTGNSFDNINPSPQEQINKTPELKSFQVNQPQINSNKLFNRKMIRRILKDTYGDQSKKFSRLYRKNLRKDLNSGIFYQGLNYDGISDELLKRAKKITQNQLL